MAVQEPVASDQPEAGAPEADGGSTGDGATHNLRGPGAIDGVTGFMGMRWEDPQTVRLTIRPELINAGGLLSGVVTYALVDYCMGSTLWAQTSAEEAIATISISVNYIQTATEGDIVCRTTLDRRNRRTAVMRSEVSHEDGRLLVTAIGSYTIFPRRKGATAPAGQPPKAVLRTALAIAGSDSGGGAGIQADLKAFARCGVHGTTAITAITAQNTVGVQAIHAVEPEAILAQVRAVCADIRVDAVKVGMLGSARTVRAVAQALEELPEEIPDRRRSGDGRRVRREAARGRRAGRADRSDPAARERDHAEPARGACARRSGAPRSRGARDDDDAAEAEEAEALARAMIALGPRAVVVTGGHRRRAIDVFLQAGRAGPVEIAGERHPRRRCARVGVHALVGAGRAARARQHRAAGGAHCARADWARP